MLLSLHTKYQKHQQEFLHSCQGSSVSSCGSNQITLLTWQFGLKMDEDVMDGTKTSAQQWDLNKSHTGQRC